MSVTLSEPEIYFLRALVERGGLNVKPPPLRTDPYDLYREDDRARQKCRKAGLAHPVKPGSPFWSITPLAAKPSTAWRPGNDHRD